MKLPSWQHKRNWWYTIGTSSWLMSNSWIFYQRCGVRIASFGRYYEVTTRRLVIVILLYILDSKFKCFTCRPIRLFYSLQHFPTIFVLVFVFFMFLFWLVMDLLSRPLFPWPVLAAIWFIYSNRERSHLQVILHPIIIIIMYSIYIALYTKSQSALQLLRRFASMEIMYSTLVIIVHLHCPSCNYSIFQHLK